MNKTIKATISSFLIGATVLSGAVGALPSSISGLTGNTAISASAATITSKNVGTVKGLTISSYSKNHISISWGKKGKVDGYYVYYGTSDKTSKMTKKTVTATSFTTPSTLTTGTKYYFKVIPYRKTSSGSKVKGSSKTISQYTKLNDVSGIKLSSKNGKAILSWNKSKDIGTKNCGYEIEYYYYGVHHSSGTSGGTSANKTVQTSSVGPFTISYNSTKEYINTDDILNTLTVSSGTTKKTLPGYPKEKIPNSKYYCQARMRSYKTVDGKKIYSKWSSDKTVKIKF